VRPLEVVRGLDAERPPLGLLWGAPATEAGFPLEPLLEALGRPDALARERTEAGDEARDGGCFAEAYT